MILPRLYPILDTRTLAERNCPPLLAAEAMVEGGARILQFRHKGPFSRAVFEQAGGIAALCRQAGVLFIVDDRADVARLLDAGLHVGQDDLPPGDARRLIRGDRVLGFSTHNEGQLRAAATEPVDYLALGPLFGTTTKGNPDPVVGVGELGRLRPLDKRPLAAIGGITRENALSVLEAGADSVAVIGDLVPEECTFDSIRERMKQWQSLVK